MDGLSSAIRAVVNSYGVDSDVVQKEIILFIGGVLDGHKLGVFRENVFIKRPSVLIVGGYLLAPDEGEGVIGGCGIAHLESLRIVVIIVLVVERHHHGGVCLQFW